MASYKRQVSMGGAWAKGSALQGVKKAKIKSETEPFTSQFQNPDGSVKMQDVCKVQYQGLPEVLNTSLNRTTINALVEAFGEDSKAWMEHELDVNILESDKGFSIYFIPEGFERVRINNRIAIVKTVKEEIPTIQIEDEQAFPQSDEEEIRIEDVPF